MWRRPSEGTLPVSFPWHQSLSLPLPCLRGEVLRGVQPPTVFPVDSVCTVPVRPDHPCRLPCSAASFCSSSVDSRDMSVPVGSFSPLAPVHLVCPLQFSQFQAEVVDYPDRAAAHTFQMVATMLFALASRPCQTPCSQPHPTYVLPSITRLSLMPTSRLKFYVVGLRALSHVMTIQFVQSRNSVWTWLGGAVFCKGGIGLVSSSCQNKLSSWFPNFIWCRRYSVLWCYLQRPVVLRFVVSITATPVYCVQGTLSRCCGCVSMVLEEGRVLVWQWNGGSCSVFWHF